MQRPKSQCWLFFFKCLSCDMEPIVSTPQMFPFHNYLKQRRILKRQLYTFLCCFMGFKCAQKRIPYALISLYFSDCKDSWGKCQSHNPEVIWLLSACSNDASCSLAFLSSDNNVLALLQFLVNAHLFNSL